MPFNKEKLAAMTATNVEYLDSEGIAIRLGVTNRTVEQMFERYAKRVRIDRVLYCNVWLYRWSDVLECAKIHTGITKEHIPTKKLIDQQQHIHGLKKHIHKLESDNEYLKDTIDQLYDQIKQLTKDNEQFQEEIERLQEENEYLQDRLVPF